MSPVLPFEIIALIIDIVGEDKDADLLKELALVSHPFLQICSKHLFATIVLHDSDPTRHVASSKKRFVELLKSRPEVVKYIRKLTYKTDDNDCYTHPFFDNDDEKLTPILSKFLRTISLLNYLKIDSSKFSTDSTTDWNKLKSSLTSAFLHLMHLPTLYHIDISFMSHFPLFSLASNCVNLHQLDILRTFFKKYENEGSFEIAQSEATPEIREFNTMDSSIAKLLHAKRQDGRRAFNFTNLRRLSMSFAWSEDERNLRFLLQNAKLLESLHLLVRPNWSLVRLHDILSPIARTLKILHLSVPLHSVRPGVLCEDLEAMAGHNVLETLSCEIRVIRGLNHDAKDFIGSTFQNMGKVLVKPGWSALRQVSFHVSFRENHPLPEDLVEFCEELQSLPDGYLSHLSKLESVAFNYSASLI